MTDHTNKDLRPLISIKLKIAYLILSLPASMTIGCLIAQISTAHVSSFEGAHGYAWISILMFSTPLVYIVCLGLLPVIIYKYPKYLEKFVILFGLLSLGLIGIINM